MRTVQARSRCSDPVVSRARAPARVAHQRARRSISRVVIQHGLRFHRRDAASAHQHRLTCSNRCNQISVADMYRQTRGVDLAEGFTRDQGRGRPRFSRACRTSLWDGDFSSRRCPCFSDPHLSKPHAQNATQPVRIGPSAAAHGCQRTFAVTMPGATRPSSSTRRARARATASQSSPCSNA